MTRRVRRPRAAGCSRSHRSITCGQRGAKRTARRAYREVGRASRDRRAGARRGAPSASTGSAPACTGVAGARRAPRVGASSTISPAYMTATRSATSRDDGEVVGDQEHRHPQLGLELCDQLEDLRLHRHVERRRRLVGEQQLGFAGRAPSRSLPAAACRPTARAGSSRTAGGRRGCEPARASTTASSVAAARLMLRCALIASTICEPIVNSGSSEVIGSWKTIEMRSPRISRSSESRAGGEVLPVEHDLARDDPPERLRQQPHDRERQSSSCPSPTRPRGRASRPARA